MKRTHSAHANGIYKFSVACSEIANRYQTNKKEMHLYDFPIFFSLIAKFLFVIKYMFDQILLRPNKKISVFRVTGLKFLGRVGNIFN